MELTSEHKDKINKLLLEYQLRIRPLIPQIEVLDGEFPVPIFNELRGFLNHLASIALLESGQVINPTSNIETELDKAASHIKRAALDCYKFLCVSLEDEYNKFEKDYKDTDLSLVSDGKFIQ